MFTPDFVFEKMRLGRSQRRTHRFYNSTNTIQFLTNAAEQVAVVTKGTKGDIDYFGRFWIATKFLALFCDQYFVIRLQYLCTQLVRLQKVLPAYWALTTKKHAR